MYDFTLTGYLNSEVAEVYRAFYQPDVLSKWFAPGNLVVSQLWLTFKVGCEYRAVFEGVDGFQQTVVGTYQQIIENKKISFTWRWDDTNDMTKVDMSFVSLSNNTTKLTVSQSGFAKEQDMLHQQYAWLDCLEQLSLTMRECVKTYQIPALNSQPNVPLSL